MNKYIRRLFGAMSRSQQTPQSIRVSLQPLPAAPEERPEYWQAQNLTWRTEPEVDASRQAELSKRRALVVDIERGIYPFRGMKLSRADVEWLLATHENGRGPVDWSNESQRKRRGLDLRGADLSHENLSGLPLARLNAGLEVHGRFVTEEQGSMAAMHMEDVNLEGAQLQQANLKGVQLQQANLKEAQLQQTNLKGAQLQQASFFEAQLQRAYLKGAQLQGADLSWTQLEQANLSETQLQGANFFEADLPKTYLYRAQLQGSRLNRVKLEDAFLDEVILCDEKYGPAYLADVDWGTANLAVVDWAVVRMLGEEKQAHKTKAIDDCRTSVRANRQLAVVLQAQGLNEDASRFAYHAQVLQRTVLWKQGNFWKWLGSAMLALLAGYGYRMWRILVAYLIVVSACTVAYFVLSIFYGPQMSFLDAVLTSITAFHGRVFSEPFQHSPQLWVTAFEAIAGLVIEGVFIAMLTQKFFGK